MPNYSYTAKTFDGQTQKGVLNAKDEAQLAQVLKNQNMMLIKSVSDEHGSRLLSFSLPFGRVPLTEKIMMTRNLGVMFATGLSLIKSFDILSAQAKNKQMKKALLDIKERINKGENLSNSLAQYPDIFSELFINMVKIGEESGNLEEILQTLSLQLTKEHELRSKIKNAMIYPSLIMAVMLVVGAIIVTVVLPSLSIFFQSLNVDIPIYTRIMLAAGNFLSVHWYLLIVVPLLLAGSGYMILRTKKGKRGLDTLLLKLPVFAGIVRKNNSAFFVRSLSSMTAAGVPLVRSLEISSKIVTNHYFEEAILEAGEQIKKGDKLSHALRIHQSLFPFGVLEMIEVGEETGKTSAILKKLAEFYEQEAIASIERLSVLIEPMLIIVMGLGVGFFAFSIIQPMYSSLQLINT